MKSRVFGELLRASRLFCFTGLGAVGVAVLWSDYKSVSEAHQATNHCLEAQEAYVWE